MSTDAAPALALGQTWPTPEQFRTLAAGRRVIPVVRRVLADAETPLSVYRKLAKGAPGTFLLESAGHGGAWSRYSFVGVRSRAMLTERDGAAHWVGQPPAAVPTEGDPLDVLRDTVAALATEAVGGLPPLTGGMVGFLGYDIVRHWERLGDTATDDLGLPTVAMLLATDLAVLDHLDGSLLLVANAVNMDDTDERVDEAYADAITRLDAMVHDLTGAAPSTVAVVRARTPHPESTMTRERFLAVVEQAQEAIRAGEAFQVVVSQRFSVPCSADALDVYRALRASNPSPYMYLLRLQDAHGRRFDIVGSSPEALVTVTDRSVVTHPIAGSRPRGQTPEQDLRHERELLADPKERSEHVMLVDLSRNDLQRVCHPGTVEVVELMAVRRYSHIMHIESTVVGRLREDRSAFDVLVATFPAGTLSGAPKPRAMQLIEQYEGTRRGVYGGVVGYLDFHGDLDLAIAIRTAVIADGRAHVQAGAGIVADSVPQAEYAETVTKAAAALRAVAAAEGMSAP